MKIIDYVHLGNVVSFILGEDNLENWYGDDWNDAPYEHNAGMVYPEFISGFHDIAFPTKYSVIEPKNVVYNTPYSKNDMKERRIPCIIVVPLKAAYEWWNAENFINTEHEDVIKFYMGDTMEPSDEMEVWHGNKA